VFRMEKSLLEQAGHEVIAYERHNDEIGDNAGTHVKTSLEAAWSNRSYRDIATLITRYRPDVAHFHNTFPLISPSAYRACRDGKVPVVQTLHNYRLICPGALLMRDGQPCEECVGRNLIPAIRYACYRRSHVATGIATSMLLLNRARGAYRNDVDRYIALTQFARDRFIRGGLPAARIVVRPNFLSEPPAVGVGGGGFALYVGRLTAEKGVTTLVNAWRGVELPLKIVGDGQLRQELEMNARTSGAKIDFLGYRPRSEVLALMQQATMVVIPSECYEGFPVTALEAFATGAPLVVAAIGALDEIIEAPTHGLKFRSRDPAALRECVLSLIGNPSQLAAMRAANRALFVRHYTRAHAVDSLESIYRQVTSQLPVAAQNDVSESVAG
jgi:glycosyltransferase involved in cell wall biosynthesis